MTTNRNKYAPFVVGEAVCRRGKQDGPRGTVVDVEFVQRGFSMAYWTATVNWEGLCNETLRSDYLEKRVA